MLPIVFDWHWTWDRIVFMGYLWLALGIIGLGLAVAFYMTLRNLKSGGGHHQPQGHEEH
ncbi:MAG: hypothetical protein AB1896_09710 [Thermodesulfobacteriota bacterium]